MHVFAQYIFLILIILGLVMIANRIRIAYPIVLVIGGLCLSFSGQFTEITIQPEMIFFIFLPPLLYEAAWQVSWKEFWRWRRVITSFAFPVVIITSCVVAFASTALIPGFTLAMGFLLGGIVSPPDAVSATTIMRGVKVPRALLSIIEGESLLNDASSLVVFRFALAAVITGQFHFSEAAGNFLLVIAFGILIGVAVGFVFYALHRWLPTTPGIDIVLTLISPYCMYYAAEHFHMSGVLAVVSGGLLLSSQRQRMFSYQTRIQWVNVWTSLVFVFNGLVFFLIGLQLVSVTRDLGDVGLGKAIAYGMAISLVLIVARLLSTFGASGFTRFMSRFIKVADDNPGWKGPLVLGWAGMRGVVSLAMALSIPMVLPGGEAFPFRNLILFLTFVVILVTLVLQGLTLPWLIRKLNMEDKFSPISHESQEVILQKKMALAALKRLEENHSELLQTNDHLRNLRERLKIDVRLLSQQFELHTPADEYSFNRFTAVYLDLLEHQREILTRINQHAEFDEELIRKYLALVDMEEFKVHETKLV